MNGAKIGSIHKWQPSKKLSEKCSRQVTQYDMTRSTFEILSNICRHGMVTFSTSEVLPPLDGDFEHNFHLNRNLGIWIQQKWTLSSNIFHLTQWFFAASKKNLWREKQAGQECLDRTQSTSNVKIANQNEPYSFSLLPWGMWKIYAVNSSNFIYVCCMYESSLFVSVLKI